MSDPRRLAWLSLPQLVGVAGLCVLSGCALTSKSDPMNPRYFDLDLARAKAGTTAEPMPSAERTRHPERLRLGQVEASEHLDERLVFRSTPQEIGYYEGQRWSERPREYLRRALSRELYERRGLTRVVSGPAPTLEVELSSFEEVRGGRAVARVRLTYVLHDEEAVRIERTLTVDRPVRASAPQQRSAAVVAAMAEAMQEAVLLVAQQVTSALPSMQSPVTAGECPPQSVTNAADEPSDDRPRALDTQ